MNNYCHIQKVQLAQLVVNKKINRKDNMVPDVKIKNKMLRIFEAFNLKNIQ